MTIAHTPQQQQRKVTRCEAGGGGRGAGSGERGARARGWVLMMAHAAATDL